MAMCPNSIWNHTAGCTCMRRPVRPVVKSDASWRGVIPPADVSGDHGSPFWRVRLEAARRVRDAHALEWALDNEWDRDVQEALYRHPLFKTLPEEVRNKERDWARDEVDIDLMAGRRDAAAAALAETTALHLSGGRFTNLDDGVELQCPHGVRVRVRALDSGFRVERIVIDGAGDEVWDGSSLVDADEVAATARRAAVGKLPVDESV